MIWPLLLFVALAWSLVSLFIVWLLDWSKLSWAERRFGAVLVLGWPLVVAFGFLVDCLPDWPPVR